MWPSSLISLLSVNLNDNRPRREGEREEKKAKHNFDNWTSSMLHGWRRRGTVTFSKASSATGIVASDLVRFSLNFSWQSSSRDVYFSLVIFDFFLLFFLNKFLYCTSMFFISLSTRSHEAYMYIYILERVNNCEFEWLVIERIIGFVQW